MAYDQSVRTLMNNNGYDNSKIGYNQDSGYVTYGGQNFMKPQMNVNGTTYTDQSTFDNAHNQYKTNGANTVTAYNTTQQPATQPTNQGYTNPYTQQITDILSRINAASQSQPVDVYSTPQYAAAQAQAQRGADESIRAGQEMFGNDRMARSSDALQFGQNAQNKANEYLNLQLVPQIQSLLQAQKQQELQNQQAMFQNLFGLSNQADNRYNSDRTYDAGRQDAATAATGYYTPDANTLSSVRKQMEANSAAYGTASPERQKQLHEENLKLAASIGGSDTTGNGDYAFGPTRTVQGQELDYNQQKDQRDFKYQTIQDAIKNGMSQQQIDNQAKQFADRLGYDYDSMDSNNKQAWAQIAISQKNADTSAASQGTSSNNAKLNQLMDIWDRTGVAPAGIPGVQAGTPLQGKSSQPSATQNKNELESQYVSGFDGLSPEMRKKAFAENKAEIIKDLGKSGYDALYKTYFNEYGDPR